MCPVIHIPLFGIVTLQFPAYALFAFVGLLFMMLLLYFRVERISMEFRTYLLMILCLAVGVGIGSKALFVVTKLPEIVNDFSFGNTLYIVITSGFVFYGGLLAPSWDCIFSAAGSTYPFIHCPKSPHRGFRCSTSGGGLVAFLPGAAMEEKQPGASQWRRSRTFPASPSNSLRRAAFWRFSCCCFGWNGFSGAKCRS